MNWSVTRAQTLGKCDWLYWLKYVARIPASQPTSPALIHGRLVHVGIAAAFAASRHRPVEGTMDVFGAEAHAAVLDYWERDEPIRDRAREDASSEVFSLLSRLPVPPLGAILGIEKEFALPMGDTTVKGALDLALFRPPTGVHVVDWKTGALPETLSLNTQMGTYTEVAHVLWPWATKITVGLCNTRTGQEKTHEFEPEVSQAIVDRLLEREQNARITAQRVSAGTQSIREAYPFRPGKICASCSHRSFCPLFAKADPPVRNQQIVEQGRERIADLLNTA